MWMKFRMNYGDKIKVLRGMTMKRYKVWVCLDCTYNDIEAEDEDDALLQATEYAIEDASWKWLVEEVEDE